MLDRLPSGWQTQCKGYDVESLKLSMMANLEYRLAKDQYSATKYDRFLSAAYAVMDRLVEHWIITQQTYHIEKPKRVYYLSMEFLMGRSLGNSLINLGIYDECKLAMEEMRMDIEETRDCEVDAALGNGGLGRLAACFLDSMATLDIPAHGYGIRFDYGIFRQKIVEGRQVELPDNWLSLPNPWEIARPELLFKIRFGGRTRRRVDHDGKERSYWLDTDDVQAMAYDTPIPGYQTETVNTLRLWRAQSSEELDFESFNCGDYLAACERKVVTENITKVLYPNDNISMGRELRLKQEYFLVSASLQDIVRRYKHDGQEWTRLPDEIAIQLNDTHPTLAIPELMRILIDEEDLDWDTAWDITTRTFAYTNHTLLPEALEQWPVQLIEILLPRHMEIIYLINHHFLRQVAQRYPGDVDRMRRMSIIAEDGYKRVRMANLAIIGSHKVNGVAELHSKILRESTFRDFAEFWPDKFTNKTNGITPRRWLRKANPDLSELISSVIGDEWVRDLDQLRQLEPYCIDSSFRNEWRRIKQSNKLPLIETIHEDTGVIVNPNTLFDVQVKRIHEYKRQLLFALYIIRSYLRAKETPGFIESPRTFLLAGKAAPGYHMAKLTIHLVNRIADIINHDNGVKDLLRVAFLPNYRVSLAEKLIPAADLSEQISTAGMEASGTGNMKFALNGALTIGTLDGANIEIMEEVGAENIFIFGMTAEQVNDLKSGGYRPWEFIERSPELQRVMHLLECDYFCPGEPGLFRPIYDALTQYDPFCLMADFESYVAMQDKISQIYQDEEHWTRMSILNVARCGKFSSDRTIREYAEEIWHTPPVQVPSPFTPSKIALPV